MIYYTHDRLFGPGGCLTALALRSYADGSLGSNYRKQVDDHIRKCQLCAEALQGFKKHAWNGTVKSDLKFLSRRIRNRYTGETFGHGRRLSVVILLSIVTLLVVLLGFFIIFRQTRIEERPGFKNTADTAVNAVIAIPDSSGITTVKQPGEIKRDTGSN